MRRHLPGQADDRDRIHQRVGEAGYRVGGTRAARHQHHPDPPGRSGIAFGGMDRAPLLTHQDVAQRILLEQRIVDREDRAAGIAEYDIDALIDERLDDDISSTDRLGRHDTLLNRNNGKSSPAVRPQGAGPGSGTLVSYVRPVNRKWAIK